MLQYAKDVASDAQLGNARPVSGVESDIEVQDGAEGGGEGGGLGDEDIDTVWVDGGEEERYGIYLGAKGSATVDSPERVGGRI